MINEYGVACLLESDSVDQLRRTLPFMDQHNLPHISLFQFKSDDLDFITRMQRKIESLVTSNRFLTSDIAPAGDNLFLDVVDDQTLLAASDCVSEFYASDCEEKEPLSQIYMSELSNEKQGLVRRYGIYWIRHYFRPHVTLSYDSIPCYDLSIKLPDSVGVLPIGLYPIDSVGRILPFQSHYLQEVVINESTHYFNYR